MSYKNLPVTIHGHTYTLSEASRRFQVPWNTIRQRYTKHESEDALVRPVKKVRVFVHGKRYSLGQLSIRYRLNKATVYSRYYAGKRGEDLIKTPRFSFAADRKDYLSKQNSQYVHLQGKDMTLKEVSQTYRLPLATVKARYHRGDRDARLVRPLGERVRTSRPPLRVMIRGHQRTFQELSQYTGISVNTIQSRYYRGKRGSGLLVPQKR